jgi:hypothetical protein
LFLQLDELYSELDSPPPWFDKAKLTQLTISQVVYGGMKLMGNALLQRIISKVGAVMAALFNFQEHRVEKLDLENGSYQLAEGKIRQSNVDVPWWCSSSG